MVAFAAAGRRCFRHAQTAASAEPFPAWHLLGKQLSDDLDATVVDDQGQPLTLHDFAVTPSGTDVTATVAGFFRAS